MCFWYCWKDLDEQDLMKFILQVFGLKMWEISNFKCATTNSNIDLKKKPSFGKKNQLRMWSPMQIIFNSSKIGYKV
jgi:hypothetical protein